jgi:hypothetical protein
MHTSRHSSRWKALLGAHLEVTPDRLTQLRWMTDPGRAPPASDVVDSSNQSMLDNLFYLKHSHWSAHRRATAGYTCMQLYGLVNDVKLHALVSDELEQDCRSCGRCRFLLASCSSRHQKMSSSERSDDISCDGLGDRSLVAQLSATHARGLLPLAFDRSPLSARL